MACYKGGDIELWAFLATVADEEKKDRQEVWVCVSQLREFTPGGWNPHEKSPGWNKHVGEPCKGVTDMLKLWTLVVKQKKVA